jgi:hypothetical protein
MARLLATVAAITTFVGLAGCSKGGDAGGVATTDSPIGQSAATSPPQPDMVAAQGESFERFWMVFRQAVLAGDKDRVASMTRFPFETRGTMDDDPVKTHDRASFLRILDRLLADDAGTTAASETMRQYIERTTTLTERNVAPGDTEARVGNFGFARLGGRWLFTRAYIDE